LRRAPDVPDDNVFDIGDRTIGLLRQQAFEVDDYGTLVTSPGVTPTVEVAKEPPPEEPLVRVERKLDVVIATMCELKRRIDSIDSVLARLTSR